MLTDKRRQFVVEYLKDSNATQAAIRAGFSKKTAGAAGARLLKDVRIQQLLAPARAEVAAEAKVTLSGHLATLADIRDKAIAAKQFGPATNAEAKRGKVSGFYVDRVGGPDGGAIPLAVTVTRTIVKK